MVMFISVEADENARCDLRFDSRRRHVELMSLECTMLPMSLVLLYLSALVKVYIHGISMQRTSFVHNQRSLSRDSKKKNVAKIVCAAPKVETLKIHVVIFAYDWPLNAMRR